MTTRAPGRTNKIAATPFMSVNEAAEYLGVSTRTIRQMIVDGRLTGYKSGTRLVRLRLEELDAAMRPFGGAA
jgi:excisionase family DNA binding protein